MSSVAVTLISVLLAAPLTIQPDGVAAIDGKRTFILGLYENPKEDSVLKDVAAAGFNIVAATEDQAALDRLHASGLYAWINTGNRVDFSDARPDREAKLKEMVDKYAQHPALIAWEVPDEALWNCYFPAAEWRIGKEPKQQRELIAALTDPALKEKLSTLRADADRETQTANYVKAEQIADDIWKQLGKEQPQPGVNYSFGPQAAAKLEAGMVEGYQRLKELDSKHPIWMNYAPRNLPEQLAGFAKAADIVGCDIYPVPTGISGHTDLIDTSLSSVGAYTDRFQQAAPKKPVWMVLQGFGWGDIQPEATPEQRKIRRRPDARESRFMAYDAIVHGARGILYWGTAHIEKDSELWRDLLKLARELADLQPVLTAPDAKLSPAITFANTPGSVDRSLKVLAKNVNGKTWLLVVNEWPSGPLRYTLHGLDSLNGTRYVDAASSSEAQVARGELTLGIPAIGVHVLQPVGDAPAK
ncbi:MAG: beta-galactosidase [Candidatus Hydrogenedentes bacterium]|nr:beta-galactosidase [Candidatus Hydrogenedentota bacterium]